MKQETSMQSKTKICIFVHFSTSKKIPYNVQIYANELSKYFDEVHFLTNNKDNAAQIDFFKGNIFPVFDRNEGYDFGRIYNFTKILMRYRCFRLTKTTIIYKAILLFSIKMRLSICGTISYR